MAFALLLAAGSGERLDAGVPKAFVELDGRPMLEWSIDGLRRSPSIKQIIVALPPGVDWSMEGVTTVVGGASRSESVRNALAAVTVSCKRMLVHDAARPFLTVEMIDQTLAKLADYDAATVAVPVTDTIKEANAGMVTQTVDRSRLWAVQTPQTIRRELYNEILKNSPDLLVKATDDMWLVEQAGGSVAIVESSKDNFKITVQADLDYARYLLTTSQQAAA